MTEIRTVQVAAWKNKIAKGFNTTDVPLEFCYLSAEVAEAFDAWRKGRTDLGEELADVALFLVSLAEMNGVDLQAEVEAKLAKNAGRVYVTGANGLTVRADKDLQALGALEQQLAKCQPIVRAATKWAAAWDDVMTEGENAAPAFTDAADALLAAVRTTGENVSAVGLRTADRLGGENRG